MPPETDTRPKIESLKDAIKLAAEGDEDGQKVVEANVFSDAIERTLKVGHIREVELEVDKDGDVHQFGHSMERVQANSLVYASNNNQMAGRVEAETNNAFRIKESYHAGDLEDGAFVVLSRADDSMSQELLKKNGFFTDTMTATIQVHTVKNGVLTVESAFVAGTKRPGEARHDEETVIALGEMLGVDFSGKGPTEIIDTPLMIDGSLIPNGVIDLVRMYDDCAGGTFFGEAKPRQDYLKFRDDCAVREAGFKGKVEAIKAELLAGADSINTELEATERLAEISEKHMVDKAIEDDSIDPRALGEKAAPFIIEARQQRALGNHEAAKRAEGQAKLFADSNSCPGGAKGLGIEGADFMNIGNSEQSNDWHGGQIFRNSKCRSCKEVKEEVGACRICKHCVDSAK